MGWVVLNECGTGRLLARGEYESRLNPEPSAAPGVPSRGSRHSYGARTWEKDVQTLAVAELKGSGRSVWDLQKPSSIMVLLAGLTLVPLLQLWQYLSGWKPEATVQDALHATPNAPSVRLDHATVTGVRNGSLEYFLGIPYAQPP